MAAKPKTAAAKATRAKPATPKDTQADPMQPLPNAAQDSVVIEKSPAAWMYDRLILYIRNFEKQLDSAHEIAMGFAGGDAGVLRIEGLGFFDPDVVTFYGRDEDGSKTQLIQHVTQVSVILRAVRKEEPDAPARRIGFLLATGWQGGESGDGSA